MFVVKIDTHALHTMQVIQMREAGKLNFHQSWARYRDGFGDASEYWLGNDHISSITTRLPYTLRVQLQNNDGGAGFAQYDHFVVGPESTDYSLMLDVYKYTSSIGRNLAQSSSFLSFTSLMSNRALPGIADGDVVSRCQVLGRTGSVHHEAD